MCRIHEVAHSEGAVFHTGGNACVNKHHNYRLRSIEWIGVDSHNLGVHARKLFDCGGIGYGNKGDGLASHAACGEAARFDNGIERLGVDRAIEVCSAAAARL